jgi:hypothetical protein
MAPRNPISSGADPRLQHACDLIAVAGGRIVAGMLDDLIALIEAGVSPREAAERVLHRYAAAAADINTLHRVGATAWPPATQVVPQLPRPRGPISRSFSPGRRAA